MCRGSVRARNTMLAVAGMQYLIGKTEYDDQVRPDRQGVIYAQGNGYEPSVGDDKGKIVGCAACIETETRVMLSGIPAALQKRLGLDQVVVATFVPGAETVRDSQDQIRLDDGRQFKLWEFADQGVTLSLVMAETDSDTRTAPMTPAAVPEPTPAMA